MKEYKNGVDNQLASFSAQTVYIEAQDGVPFWICYEALPGYGFTIGDCVTFAEVIDGRNLAGSVIRREGRKWRSGGVYSSDESRRNSIQQFQFSVLSSGMCTPHSLERKL